jgi:hypothetical protein
MFNRIKNILVTPKTEWPVIAGEGKSHITVLTGYVLILAAIPAVAAFIGYGLVGYNVLGHHFASIGYGVRQAIVQYISSVAGVYLTAWVIDLLAGNFGATKNFDRAFSLVAYAWTATFVGGIFYLLPGVKWLAGLCSIYSFVLLYMGLKPMMKVPDDKQTGYFVVSLLVMIGASMVLTLVLGTLIAGGVAAASF